MKIVILDAGKLNDPATVPLVDDFIMGADDHGVHDIQIIRLATKEITGCDRCEECLSNGGWCVKNDDDGVNVLKQVAKCDFLVSFTRVVDGDLSYKFASLFEMFMNLSQKPLEKPGILFVLYDNYVPESEVDEIIDKYKELAGYINLDFKVIQKVHTDKFGNLIYEKADRNTTYNIGFKNI